MLVTLDALQLHQICRALLANEQGGPLPQMRMHPKQSEVCRDLTAVVIHVIAVLHCVTQSSALQPLMKLLENPGEKKVCMSTTYDALLRIYMCVKYIQSCIVLCMVG